MYDIILYDIIVSVGQAVTHALSDNHMRRPKTYIYIYLYMYI